MKQIGGYVFTFILGVGVCALFSYKNLNGLPHENSLSLENSKILTAPLAATSKPTSRASKRDAANYRINFERIYARLGLRAGDTLTEVNGEKADSVRIFITLISAEQIGAPICVKYLRVGRLESTCLNTKSDEKRNIAEASPTKDFTARVKVSTISSFQSFGTEADLDPIDAATAGDQSPSQPANEDTPAKAMERYNRQKESAP